MFLPLGASWSLDARRRGGPSPPRLVTGGAPAALLLQVAFIYVFNALYKDGAAWTTDFTAVERFLANSVWGIAAWTPFLPTWFWTRVAGAAVRAGPPADDVPRAPVPAPAGAAALALVGYVCLLNVVGLYGLFGKPAPALLGAPAVALQIDQKWNMFSPQPAAWSQFLALHGETAAGRTVDLLAGGPGGAADTLRPPSGRFAADRWRTYLRYLRRQPAASQQRLGERLARYLGRQWNAAHGPEDRVARVRLYRVAAPIRLAGAAEPDGRRMRVWTLVTVAVGGEKP